MQESEQLIGIRLLQIALSHITLKISFIELLDRTHYFETKVSLAGHKAIPMFYIFLLNPSY
jgi:hypothetical protein